MPDLPPVAAAVIVEQGRVLLIRRRHPEGDLVWQLPAGELEDGETASQAAERETAEETGLHVTACHLLGTRVHPDTGRYMVYVACEVAGGHAHVADEDEVAEVAWVEPGELGTYVPRPFYGPVQDHLGALIHVS